MYLLTQPTQRGLALSSGETVTASIPETSCRARTPRLEPADKPMSRCPVLGGPGSELEVVSVTVTEEAPSQRGDPHFPLPLWLLQWVCSLRFSACHTARANTLCSGPGHLDGAPGEHACVTRAPHLLWNSLKASIDSPESVCLG